MEGDEADTENSFNCDLECPMRMKQITLLHIHMVSTIYSWENSTTSTASCNCAYRSVTPKAMHRPQFGVAKFTSH